MEGKKTAPPRQDAERSGDTAYVVYSDKKPITLETVEYDGVKSPAGSILKSIKTLFKSG